MIGDPPLEHLRRVAGGGRASNGGMTERPQSPEAPLPPRLRGRWLELRAGWPWVAAAGVLGSLAVFWGFGLPHP